MLLKTFITLCSLVVLASGFLGFLLLTHEPAAQAGDCSIRIWDGETWETHPCVAPAPKYGL